ncbi:NUDIX hydrolase [Bosea sp. NPDC055594]
MRKTGSHVFASCSGAPETVSALFLRTDGKVLLGLRASWKRAWADHWDAIGGRVEAGEGLDEALLRECREEVGLVPTVYRLMLSAPEYFPERNGAALHHIYVVSAWDGETAENLTDEHSEIGWFSLDEMAALPNLTVAELIAVVQEYRAAP